MSLRLLSTKLVKHGRYFLQGIWKRELHNILEQQQKTRNRLTSSAKALKSAVTSPASQQSAAKNVLQTTIGSGAEVGAGSLTARKANGIFRFGQHARKLFIDNILNRCTSPYAEPLRSQATKRLFYGDSAPFFALIGVSLASGSGILTKEDEFDGVCWEIREAANRWQKTWNYDGISETLTSDFNIDKLNVGPPIAKGCAAVVYGASFKEEPKINKENVKPEENINLKHIETIEDLLATSPKIGDGLFNNPHDDHLKSVNVPQFISPLRNMSRLMNNFGSSVDNIHNISHAETIKQLKQAMETLDKVKQRSSPIPYTKSQETNSTNSMQSQGSQTRTQKISHSSESTDLIRYPLALKMMFNYDIQSNALAILRAMYKETVPARQRYINPEAEGWERLLQDQTLTLPPHPNIVTMFGFFCDEVKNFQDGHLLYPVAQPQRINPDGYGRNMSLYLLMKRYDYSLRNLLDAQELSTRTKLLLFTQLLEAVAHINNHGIAHRDIKSDNILIEMNDDDSPPTLVLSDFGCCLADKVHGLRIPYNSYDMDKGGNAALMAPEIINKQPGSFAVLNYTKADLWACGAIAYEIFGEPNPFYFYNQHLKPNQKSLISSNSTKQQQKPQQPQQALKNSNYKVEDLPPLNDSCPELVQNLIFNLLDPNPSRRVTPDIAANIMQLYLWAPSKWLKYGQMPNSPEILQWLLSLTTKIMYDGRTRNFGANLSSFGLLPPQQLSFSQHGRRTFVEYLLIGSFLARARLSSVRGALTWIQNTNEDTDES